MTGTALAFPTPTSLGSLDHYIQAVNRFPLLTAEQEADLGRRWRDERGRRRGAAARAVAPAAGRRRVAQVPGLRAAAGRPDPGGQRRPDEGRAPLRPVARRAPGLVRAALDQGRDARVHPAQLAPRQGGDDQGAAQAVLQPAQHEVEERGAQHVRGRRDRRRARREARGSARDGDAAVRPGPVARSDACRRRVVGRADRVARRRERGPFASASSAGRSRRAAATASARRCRGSTSGAAASSRPGGCARTTRRRCSNSPTSTASPPSASASWRARH